MLPHGVLALSVSTVILPTLSRLWQVGDTAAFRATLGNALRPLLFLSVPASVILFAFRLPIVQTLFQTGAFSTESTTLVAAPLAFLAAGLASYALVEALTRAFYAMHDTRTPVIAGIAIMALNILIGVTLLDRMGYLALALALSLSTTVEAMILIVVLGRRIGGVSTKTRDWLESPRVFGSDSFGRCGACRSADRGHYAGNGPKLQQIVVFLLALGVVAMVYLGCAWMLRIPELSDFLVLLSRRIPPLRRLALSRGIDRHRRCWRVIRTDGRGYTPRLASGGRTTLANERRHINGHSKIRNFSIIAHIDHGKSTLADRLLEQTNTVSQREMKAQLLDSMDLEREKGITIKARAVRMNYTARDGETYQLNLIDTPGHVDFSYEVSRSLAACEVRSWSLMPPRVSRHRRWQRLLGLEQDLAIVAVVNKIDLPSADPKKVAAEVGQLIGLLDDEIVHASAKTGLGVDDTLEAVVATCLHRAVTQWPRTRPHLRLSLRPV